MSKNSPFQSKINKIVVIGGGSFGTALGTLIAQNGHSITLLVRDKLVADDINLSKKNQRYLPNIRLPSNISAALNLNDLPHKPDVIFIATPSHSLKHISEQILAYTNEETIIVNLSKGLHEEHLTLDRALRHWMPNNIIASIKGPTFARPLVYGSPSGMTLAIDNPLFRERLVSLFIGTSLDIEIWNSVSEVEFVSAIKNVMAIAMGICDAIDDNPNTRFMVLKKIIHQTSILLEDFSYNPKSIFTYAGLGDLLMTSLNDTSRNRTLGLLLGRGFEPPNSGNGPVTEGIKSCNLLCRHAKKIGADHKMLSDIADVFYGKITPQNFHRSFTNQN